MKRRLRKLEELKNVRLDSKSERARIKAVSDLLELTLFQKKTDEEMELIVEGDPLLKQEWKRLNSKEDLPEDLTEIEKKLFDIKE